MPSYKYSDLGITKEQAQQMFSGLTREQAIKKADEMFATVQLQKQKQVEAEIKPESAESVKQYELAKSGLSAIDRVKELSTFGNRLQAVLPGQFGAGEYIANKNELIDTISRLRTGATLTKEEKEFYEGQMPQLTDSRKTIESKLNILRNFFEGIAAKGKATPFTQSVQQMSERKPVSGVTSSGLKYTIDQ